MEGSGPRAARRGAARRSSADDAVLDRTPHSDRDSRDTRDEPGCAPRLHGTALAGSRGLLRRRRVWRRHPVHDVSGGRMDVSRRRLAHRPRPGRAVRAHRLARARRVLPDDHARARHGAVGPELPVDPDDGRRQRHRGNPAPRGAPWLAHDGPRALLLCRPARARGVRPADGLARQVARSASRCAAFERTSAA